MVETLGMTTPRFRDLTFLELLGRGWRVSGPIPADDGTYDGTWFVTLALPEPNDTLIHAVTGQGVTADAARDKAVEIANAWRRMQAEQRRGKGQ